MRRETLNVLQREYGQSRDEKVRRLHAVWRPILDEFGLNNFGDVWRHIQHYRNVDDQTWLAGQGRVGSLNVLVRKMAGLVGLRDPEFLVEADNPWDEPVATVLEHAFEQQRRAADWNGEAQKTTLEACLYGTGILKVGYGSRFLYDEPAWAGQVPQGAKHLLPERDRVMPEGYSTEYTNWRVQDGMPMAIHVSAADIFYNLGVKTEEDITRIYHRCRRPLTDVLHDSRYDARAKADVTIKRYGETNDYWMTLSDYDLETSFVEVIECFDLRSRMYCVFTEFSSRPLRDWTLFPFPIQSPYHRFTPIPHPEQVWGVPYALLILGQAQSMNRLRAIIIDQISRDGKKIFIGDANRIPDPEEQRKIEAAKNGSFVWLTGIGNNEEPPWKEVDFGGARPEMLQLASLIERDQAWVSGLTDVARNDTGRTDETATAVSARMEQQGLTVDEFVERNEAFQERAAGDMMKITLARWDARKMVKVIGPDPNIYLYTSVNIARVQGSFMLKVIAGSSLKRDKATQRKQWLELLDRIGVLDDRIKMDQQLQMQTGQPGFVNWYEVLRETLGLFDTTLARKILRADNTVMLVQRLMEQYQESPLWMSPELERQVQQLAMQPRVPERSGPVAGQVGLDSLYPPGGGDSLAAFGGGAPSAGGPASPGGMRPSGVAGGPPALHNVNQATGGLFSETAGMAGRV